MTVNILLTWRSPEIMLKSLSPNYLESKSIHKPRFGNKIATEIMPASNSTLAVPKACELVQAPADLLELRAHFHLLAREGSAELTLFR